MDWDNLEAVRTAQGINIRRLARQLKVVKVATLSDFEHGHLNRLPFSDRKIRQLAQEYARHVRVDERRLRQQLRRYKVMPMLACFCDWCLLSGITLG